MIKRKYIWGILLIVFLVPVVVNLILVSNNPFDFCFSSVGKNTEWITFWGGYSGSIISGLIMLYVLYETLKQNQKGQDEIKEMQVKTIQYTQKQKWLDDLRTQLNKNFEMIDLHSFTLAVNSMDRGNLEEARSVLLYLNKNIVFQSAASSLYFPDKMSIEEQNYNDCMNNILIEYGCLINDFVFLTVDSGMKNYTKEKNAELKEYVQKQYELLYATFNDNPLVQKYYDDGNSLLTKILALSPEVDLRCEVLKAVREKYCSGVVIQQLKSKLLASTRAVLKYEEQKIDNLLN